MTPKPPVAPKPSSPLKAPTSSAEQAHCKKRFETFCKSLAQPVRDALDETAWEDAIGLAIIYNGIRDQYKLADMIFLTQYGPTRGYCGVSERDDYLTQAAYKGILQALVIPAIRDIPARQLPQQGGVDCVAHQVFRDKAHPDKPTDDLTGRYEGQFETENYTRAAFLINQAGEHIECAVVPFFGLKDKGERPVYYFYGDQRKDGSFSLFNTGDPNLVVSLHRHSQTGQVIIAYPVAGRKDVKHVLTLVSQRPTIPFGAIKLIDNAAQRIQRYERFPLPQAQVAYIMERMLPEHIEPLLEKCFSVSPDIRTVDKAKMKEAARPLMHYMEATINDGKFGTHSIDYPLAQYYAQTVLSKSRWEHEGMIFSDLNWIQRMMGNITEVDANDRAMEAIKNLTGVKVWKSGVPDTDQHPYKYRVTVELDGKALFVQGYTGTMTVEQIAPTPWPDGIAPWPTGKLNLGVTLWGFGLKVKLLGDTKIKFTGEAESFLPWYPRDFPGSFDMVRGAFDYTIGGQAGWMFLYGSETLLPLLVVFAEAEIKAKDLLKMVNETKASDPIKLLQAIDISGAWGTLYNHSLPKIDYSTAMEKTEYTNEGEAPPRSIHFCLDSAILTPAARQTLRIMCALEQAAFQSPTSSLCIIGYTDCSGPKIHHDEYNLNLSMLRAKNTLQAIRDIMGPKYAIPANNEFAIGRGEQEAAKAGCKPEINPEFRKVEIILNCRLVLTLKAQ